MEESHGPASQSYMDARLYTALTCCMNKSHILMTDTTESGSNSDLFKP